MEDETREVLQETRRTLISVRRVMWGLIFSIGAAASAATYTGHYAYEEVKHACYANHLGVEIGKLTTNILEEEGEQKRGIFKRVWGTVVPPITKEDAERQREAIARIVLKNVNDGKIAQCPQISLWEKMKAGTNRWLGKWKDVPKYVDGNNYARDAVAGKYKHPWPAEWACVNNYQANWNRKKPQGTETGRIGSMVFFCQDGSEKKCPKWNPRCKD